MFRVLGAVALLVPASFLVPFTVTYALLAHTPPFVG